MDDGSIPCIEVDLLEVESPGSTAVLELVKAGNGTDHLVHGSSWDSKILQRAVLLLKILGYQ